MKQKEINPDFVKNEASKMGLSYNRVQLKENDQEEYIFEL